MMLPYLDDVDKLKRGKRVVRRHRLATAKLTLRARIAPLTIRCQGVTKVLSRLEDRPTIAPSHGGPVIQLAIRQLPTDDDV